MRRCAIILILLTQPVFADWLDDSGYTALQTELGPAMPTGAGIPVMLSEASTGYPSLVPFMFEASTGFAQFTGTGSFAGKTITPHSGASGVSGHAQSVASTFFGNTGSMAPGVTEVHAWLANDFLNDLASLSVPAVFEGSVQNHSWVGSTNNEAIDTAILRRLDHIVDRDGVTITTPMNNGSGMTKLNANAYNTISVGLRSGNHPHTQSNIDILGRMKPDLVVSQPLTSFAGPSVASAATLLLDAIRPSYPDADDPRVLKALLIAGASKENLPGWQRAATDKPYDVTFGGGELNIRNSYHILASGRQQPSNTTERATKGWDHGSSDSAAPQRYFFTVPEGQWANTFSAAVTWHRHLSPDFATVTVANMDLRLINASGFVVGSTVDESVSSIDNVEHVFLRNLPAGQYALEVTADTDGEPYGIAWEAQIGSGPALTMQVGTTATTLNLTRLDPFKTYSIETSSDLNTWSPLTTTRTADTTPATTAQWSESVSAVRRFYRLNWTP